MAEGRGGVVKKFLGHTTPSARANVASRFFLIAHPTLLLLEEGSPIPATFSRPSSRLSANLVGSRQPHTIRFCRRVLSTEFDNEKDLFSGQRLHPQTRCRPRA